jgi:hypothetical protein
VISVSCDLGYMVTGSDDGSIFICHLKEFKDGNEASATEIISKDLERANFSLANLYGCNQLTFISQAN